VPRAESGTALGMLALHVGSYRPQECLYKSWTDLDMLAVLNWGASFTCACALLRARALAFQPPLPPPPPHQPPQTPSSSSPLVRQPPRHPSPPPHSLPPAGPLHCLKQPIPPPLQLHSHPPPAPTSPPAPAPVVPLRTVRRALRALCSRFGDALGCALLLLQKPLLVCVEGREQHQGGAAHVDHACAGHPSAQKKRNKVEHTAPGSVRVMLPLMLVCCERTLNH